jgi:hypothetical protein
MDQWLASVYGTGGGGDDLEKTAQNMLLQKLAEEEGVDLSGLDEEQLAALAQEVLGEGQQEQQMAEPTAEEQEEYLAKEAQQKFEEADFLGRVMAHSYTQELEKIATEKQADVSEEGAAHVSPSERPRKGPGFFSKVKSKLQRGAEATENFGRKGTDAIGGAAAKGGKGIAGSRVGKAVATGAKAFGGHMGRHRGKYGLGGAAAALAYGGHKAHQALSKEASAFEKLAEMRAAEILQANGVDPSTGAPMEQQTQQDPNEQFGNALDSRALEILQENGYDVSGITE